MTWTRHEHGNSWSDTQADDAREAHIHKLDGGSSRLELVDPINSGWSVWWQGERIISLVNKAIRAALKADSFAAYLKRTRGWSLQATSNFLLDRWASKLAKLRSAANAAVITKMITGWLATQSVQMKRGQVDLKKLREDKILALGVCRLCGSGPETNWHVQAECTHRKKSQTVMAHGTSHLAARLDLRSARP